MGTLESLNALAMIFIMIIPGVIMGKRNMLTLDQTQGISSLVTNLTWPCLVIDGMQIPFSKDILEECGFILIIMLITLAVSFLTGKVLVKKLNITKETGYLFMFMLLFPNTGFMGIPVVRAVLGERGVFYASIIELVQDIFVFTVGIMLIQMSAGAKIKTDLKQLLSPGLIGVVIGFILFLTSYSLPGFLGKSVAIIGNATTPLSMIIIGLQLGKMNLKSLLGEGSIYILSLFKLIVIPTLICGVIVYLMGNTSLMAKVIIMEMAMPAAACTAIFSIHYKGQVEFATRGVLLTTLFSIITLPIITLWISTF